MLLVALGRSKAAEATNIDAVKKYRELADAGSVLLLLSWIFIIALGAWSVNAARRLRKSVRDGNIQKLAVGLMVSLIFTGVRVVYSLVYTFNNSQNVQPATASFIIYFFLIFLSQLLAVLVLAATLLRIRSVSIDEADGRVRSVDEHYILESGESVAKTVQV